jgi:citrate lyase subunit beta/citryl-CoA lyase
METLIFGPGDYSAAVGIPVTTIGARPRAIRATTSTTSSRGWSCRPRGRHPGDRRPVRGVEGRGRAARARQLARALGMDGKWTIHPRQIADRQRGLHAPRARVGARARRCSRLRRSATGEGRGAAMFEGEMIDEANRKMAERIAEAGRAAGYA